MNYDNRRTELRRFGLNLEHLKKDLPPEVVKEVVNQKAEEYLDKLINAVNNFINAPNESDVGLPWVTKIIKFYSDVDRLEVADAFFQRIELDQLAKFYQKESLSFLYAFLQHIVSYLRQHYQRGDSTERRNKIISSVFQEINLGNYASSVNDNLRERWAMVSRLGYTSEDNQTLSSVISSVADCFYKVSNYTNDGELRIALRSQVTNFYSKIDFRLLGRLLEVQEKNLGPITKIIDMFEKSKCDKALIGQMVSELDFRRLARAFNDEAIGCSRLASFCKVNLYTRELDRKWKEFFEILDFNKCFTKKGFLFNRNGFSGDDNRELIRFLLDDFDIKWVENAEIRKSCDSKGINISMDENSAEIIVSEKKKEAILKIREGKSYNLKVRKYDLEVRTEDGKLKIYKRGFNFADTAIILQILLRVFKGDSKGLGKVLARFDFKEIGFKARGKKGRPLSDLFRRLLSAKLTQAQYRQFTDGFGVDECKRLANNGDLVSLWKYGCRYSDTYLYNILL